MAISTGLIVTGLGLLAVGWATVYRGRDRLVTGGLYGWLRHPQYAGLILIVVAFNLMWPTLPTLVMGPILVTVYVWLARREDRELALRFGEAFRAYAASTPAFLPGRRGLARPVATVCPADRASVEAEPVHEPRLEG
jgi:protein-S-isoprenylcysteine O-methyltransferase Ste14